MKVLIVQYLPGGESSNTKKLLDAALAVLKSGKADIETLDLVKDLPDFFTPERIGVYYERNYGGQQVSVQKMGYMAKMDRMAAQLKAADMLILAAPMYNFSQPAAVKAWFDSVMQKGVTWDLNPGVGYVGLLKGKKALFLSTSGGQYEAGHPYEHCISLTKVHLGFMGFETETVTAGGINQFPDKAAGAIAQAQAKIRDVLGKWIN
ncbi:MAG: NAD(P)H-dependent oxidoreductase [Candidatus Omnitrophica bacterium]|nr:NAD(P)H-dependent oxidoreductase [Candidatus Omnitrophota bacterium]